jgi:hypothetical protein
MPASFMKSLDGLAKNIAPMSVIAMSLVDDRIVR